MSTLELPLPFTPRGRLAWRLGWRRVTRVAGWALVAIVAIAWALLLRPQFLGGPAAYVVVSGMSMEPALHNGDLVIAHRHSSYRVGDTVLYRVPKGETGAGSLIIHRIVGGSSASGWIVQGDNKQVPDLWRPKSDDVVGSLWARVPGAGSVLAYGMSPLALASISTVLALLFGLPAAAVGAVEARSRRRRPSKELFALFRTLSGPAPPRTVTLALPPAPVPHRSEQSRHAPVAPFASWGEAAWTARDLLGRRAA